MQDLTPMTPDEVKAFRAAMGWSQAALAKAAGVTNQTVEAWEKKEAKGYWRYVFAALAAGLEPWKSQS
ncbi:MAG: helix-turn-helix domain-containing protein [Asticcacaulis sp.]|nr:helix-turn-helix domain-containing protein [Asticcacaulis sp.]